MINPISVVNKFFIIQQIPVFHTFNWIDLHQIASRSIFKEFSKGQTIYRKGDPADGFYCLISGRLCAYNLNEQEQRRDVEYIYRGMYFGIISLLTGEVHSLNFEALNDSLVLYIKKDDFDDLLKRIPKLAIDFSYSLSRRVKKQENHQKFIFESKIISTYSPRKRAGGSIYAFNLACHLKRETQKNVIFVDMRQLSSSSSALEQSDISGLSPSWKKEPADFLSMIDGYPDSKSLIVNGRESADVLNVCFDLKESIISKKISQFVSNLANDYHFIILDLPSEIDQEVLEALNQSDSVHLIVGDTRTDLISAKTFLRKVNRIVSKKDIGKKFKILVRESTVQERNKYEKINKILDHNIYAFLSKIDEDKNLKGISAGDFQVLIPSEETPFSVQMKKIAREIGDVRVGLVLGGGAALGISHIGVLKVLEKENIPVDIVTGSSIGALIGAFWALGFNAGQIEKFAREFENRLKCLHLLDIIFPKSGFIGGLMIKRWLRKKIGKKTFYDTKIPLKIIAYDLTNRKDIVIGSGDVVDAIRKSIAIPGVISPIIEKEKVIIDGGIVNPLPTNILVSMGIRKILAVNILKSPEDVVADVELVKENQQKRKPKSIFILPFYILNQMIVKVWQRLFTPNICDIIVSSFQSVDYVLAEQSAQQSDVLIHPKFSGIDWFELYKVDELISSGERATHDKIEKIKEVINL